MWLLHERLPGLGTSERRWRQARLRPRGEDFKLSPGIVLAKIDHPGNDQFTLDFVSTKSINKTQSVVISAVLGIIAGSVFGALIAIVVRIPILSPVLGALAAASITWAVTNGMARSLFPTHWTPIHNRLQVSEWAIKRIVRNERGCLPPGRYRIEAKSESRWGCSFTQPSTTSKPERLEGNGFHGSGPWVCGPYVSETVPTVNRVQNVNGGLFHAIAYSVDGSHESVIYHRAGAFWESNIQTSMEPQMPYIIHIQAGGSWLLAFD